MVWFLELDLFNFITLWEVNVMLQHWPTSLDTGVTTFSHIIKECCNIILLLSLRKTASIFGEMIVFRDLLEKTSVKAERLSMIMSKIDDVVNSVIRQCSFDRFEELVHDARKDGQVSDDEFNTMWMKATREYYGGEGEVFDHYDDMSYLWSYVSHFHAVPFYVYSYAFADLVVGSLYKVYQSTPNGFEDKLLALLAAGGSKDFVTVLRPFGLDPSKEQFWVDSIKAHLGSLVEEAEALAVELKFLDAATPTCRN